MVARRSGRGRGPWRSRLAGRRGRAPTAPASSARRSREPVPRRPDRRPLGRRGQRRNRGDGGGDGRGAGDGRFGGADRRGGGRLRMGVFCLAWDSPDPVALQRGVDDRSLPNLRGLLERGAAATIDDTQEILTPASWPTLIRAVVPARHGQLADRELVPGTYRQAPRTAEDADAPPFWRRLGAAGLRSTNVSVYSAPLEDGLPGTQVVGWGSHDPYTTKKRGPRSTPPELIAELERLVGRRELRYGLRLPTGDEERLAYVDRQLHGVEQQGRALRHLVTATEWDLFFGTIADGHEAGHVLWEDHDAAHAAHRPDAPERLRHGLTAIYEAIDRELGRLLAELAPEDVVLVVTPYGMGINPHLEEIADAVLESGGLLGRAAAGAAPGDSRVRALARARRIVHRVVPAGLRPALGRLVPRDRLVGALAFADVDWSATRAFPLWGDGSTLVRLNLRGREPEGTVAPEDYEAVRDEVIALFEGLVDADTDEPVVARAARFEDVGGGPVRGGMPEVCVQWRRGPRPRSVRTPGGAEIAVPSEVPRESIHWTNGFLIGAGPGIPATARGRLAGQPIRLVDFGATVLELLGLPSDELDGRPVWSARVSERAPRAPDAAAPTTHARPSRGA